MIANRKANPRWHFRCRAVVRVALLLPALLAVYFLLVLVGTAIPVNRKFSPPAVGVDIFVQTNGFHTDLVFPLDSSELSQRLLASGNLRGRFGASTYVAYGWGSQNYYFQSYNGQFPGVSTILQAGTGLGRSLMHVDFLTQAPRVGKQVRKIRVSPDQYHQLWQYVMTQFSQTDSQFRLRAEPGYYGTDVFLEAQGNYNVFNTCNAWTGRGLRQAGVRTSLWTPLAHSVFYLLPD